MKRRFLIVGALACAAPAWGAYNTTPTDPILQSQLGTGVWSALQKAVGSVGSFRLDDGSQPITQAQLGAGVWSALQTAVGSVGSFVVNGGSANVGIKTANPLYPLSIGAGTWVPTNWITTTNANLVSTTGSTPTANPDPVAAFQKLSSYTGPGTTNHNPALLVTERKRTTAANSFVSAFEAQAYDDVGGDTSFIEAGRFMSFIASGVNTKPEASGLVAAAAAGALGAPSNYSFLIGVEGEIDNFYADALPPEQFNANKFAASFIASDALVAGAFMADAGFMCNPFSYAKFQTCFLAPATGVNTAAFSSLLPLQSGWTLDTAGSSTFLSPGQSLNIAPGAGMLFIHENVTGTIGLIAITSGTITIMSQTGSIFVASCSPPVGKIGACWVSGQPYKLINNTTDGVTLNIMSNRLNPT